MRQDLSTETLDVVYDGSKMTFQGLLKIFEIAAKHHNKSVHTGEQSIKHFYESAQKNEILDEIDSVDWRAIRSMLKNRYHLDFAYERNKENGTYTLHFRGKDLATIKATLAKVVKTATRAERMFDQFERAKEQQQKDQEAQERGKTPEQEKDQQAQEPGKTPEQKKDQEAQEHGNAPERENEQKAQEHGNAPEQKKDPNRERDRGMDDR